MDKITQLVQLIRNFSFLQRLFNWRKIKDAAFDALEEITQVKEHQTQLESDINKLTDELRAANSEVKAAHIKMESLQERLPEKDSDIKVLNVKLTDSQNLIGTLKQELNRLENLEKTREQEHAQSLQKLEQSRDGFESYKQQLHDKEVDEIKQRQAALKRQWTEHETNVQSLIKGLCQRQLIEYVDDVPFRGNPDNTIRICDEYVVFDAKSPAGDDFTNFPAYIKTQAEAVKKYTKQEGVRNDIYLVVPSTTVEIIKEWSYHLGDYRVFIITPDAIEPVLLSLKKLEDYEFVDQLSPEERENIARVIGKFAHTTKRRVQVDQYFAGHFLDLLRQCELELPEGIQKEILEFEKAEKLNPPIERRKKQIPLDDLESKHEVFTDEVVRKKIEIPEKLIMQ